MDNELLINSNMCAVTESNLGAVLFSDFGSENLIVASDIPNTLTSLEGTLCYDESTNELVYVNMIPPNVGNSDLIVPQSVFSTLGGAPSLGDLSMFSDGGQVLLLGNNSIIVPNDEENLATANADPFVLEYVLNTPNNDDKTLISFSLKPSESSTIENGDRSKVIRDPKYNGLNGSGASTENFSARSAPLTSIPVSLKTEKENENNGRYACKVCSEKFKLLKEYKAHILSHKDKLHKCKHCGASFNKIKNLILHEAIHITNNTTCPLLSCQKKFRRLASLKAHIKLHEEEESLTCTECGEEFRNQLYLELHWKYQPQCRSAGLKENSVEKSYVCKLCDRKFEHISAFVSHKKEHDKIKKALATKNHKKRTLPSAPSYRVNRCKMCPKWFLKPSQLIRHMRIHTGERPFECTVCNKAFNQANSLKIHMLKHTGDRPYQCPFCSTGFSQRGNLRQHINRVHSIPKVEERVYECAECSCVFKKLCSLNAHKNRIHQKKYVAADEKAQVGSTEESITIENGLDDVEDEDVDELLEKKNTVHIITISLPRENGDIWQQRVFVDKKGNNRFYRCSHCPKQSLKLREIIRHLKINLCGKSFKCEFCPIKFSQHSAYLTHLTLHATAKKYTCDVCEQNFTNPAELKIHSKAHIASNEQQICMGCLKTYPAAQMNTHPCNSLLQNLDAKKAPSATTTAATEPNLSFQRHFSGEIPCGTSLSIVRRSPVTELRDKVNLIMPPYVCNYCNVTFESYLRLKMHLHDSHDASVCESCCLLFPSKEELQKHELTHHQKELTNLTCGECGKKFRSERRRDLHLKSHASSRGGKGVGGGAANAFPCSLCDKTYSHALSLRRHERRVHAADQQMQLANQSIAEFNGLNNEHENEAFRNRINGNDNTVPDFNFSNETRRFDSTQLVLTDVSSTFVKSSACDSKINNSLLLPGDCAVVDLSETSVGTIPIPPESMDPLADLFEIQAGDIPLVESDTDALPSIYNVPGAITYRCTKCLEQYATPIELQKHFQESDACNNGILSVMNSYFYACNTCFLTFNSLPTFLRHLQTHEDLKKFSCLYCGTAHKKEGELTRHIAQHALNNEYPCMYCGELSDSAESVKQHMTDIHLKSSASPKKTDVKRRKNVGCELLLTEKEKIMLAGQKPNKYSSISEKVLSSLLKKDDHSKGRNGDGDDDDDSVSGTKMKVRSSYSAPPNTCDYCEKSFKKRCDLVRHIRTHTGEKPFKCDYCNRYFRVKSILNSHLKTHFTVNNIFCHICNRFFATVGSLKIHMRLHTGDRPYQCLYCSETFRTSGHRENHHKKHESDKDRSSKSDLTAQPQIMIEIENGDAVQLELDNADPMGGEEFLLPDVTVPDNFKFQDIDLSALQNAAADAIVGEPSPSPPPPPPPPTTHSCLICDKTFKRRQDLERHANIHRAEKAFCCVICDAGFNDLGTLKTHLRRHTTPASSVCDVCHKSFASDKNLKVHKIRRHPETLRLPVQDEDEPAPPPPAPSSSPSASPSSLSSPSPPPPDHVASADDDDDVAKESDKWIQQDDVSLSNFCEKNALMSKRSDLSDFYAVDKQLDLNCMMRDLFPEYEK